MVPDRQMAQGTQAKRTVGVTFASRLAFQDIRHSYHNKETIKGVSLTAEPGDVIFADIDGVICIPRDIAHAVLLQGGDGGMGGAPLGRDPLAQHRGGALLRRLTGFDASFLYSESPTVLMHTLKVAVVVPPPGLSPEDRFARFHEELAQLLDRLPVWSPSWFPPAPAPHRRWRGSPDCPPSQAAARASARSRR